MMSAKTVVVTFPLNDAERLAIVDELRGAAEVIGLSGLDEGARERTLAEATVILAANTGVELHAGELKLIESARLIQFMTAGLDFVPLERLPSHVPVASNAGGFSEPIAEHALAMALAAAKRLIPEHAALARGEFNQFVPNRMLAGCVCGILGFGGIGVAVARLMKPLGMRIHALRRSGTSEEPVDWIGTPDRMDELLAASDVLVLSLPLTRATLRLIGARELGLMKPDAILINVARGEIVDEGALYEHLVATPTFTACLDTWWVEPIRHGEFRMDLPFLTLANVIGSPHNSGGVYGWRDVSLRRAVRNCRVALEGGAPSNLVPAAERVSLP